MKVIVHKEDLPKEVRHAIMSVDEWARVPVRFVVEAELPPCKHFCNCYESAPLWPNHHCRSYFMEPKPNHNEIEHLPDPDTYGGFQEKYGSYDPHIMMQVVRTVNRLIKTLEK